MQIQTTNHQNNSPGGFFLNQNLVITGCSKQKLPYAATVREFYQGDIFKKSVQFADQIQADLYVISGKYGLISDTHFILPYDMKIQSQEQIRNIQTQTIPKLCQILPQYLKVYLILSKTYFSTIESVISTAKMPVFRLKSSNGIFDYKKKIHAAVQGDLTGFELQNPPILLTKTKKGVDILKI